MNFEPDPNDLQLVEGDKLESAGPGQGGGLAAGGLATGAGAGTTEHGSESGNAQKSGPVNAPTTAGYVFKLLHREHTGCCANLFATAI